MYCKTSIFFIIRKKKAIYYAINEVCKISTKTYFKPLLAVFECISPKNEISRSIKIN